MSWDEMRQAFHRAVDKRETLDVRGTNGKVWAINPNLISCFEVVDPATVEAENGDRAKAEDPQAADSSAAPA
jgi:hypothetical protein